MDDADIVEQRLKTKHVIVGPLLVDDGVDGHGGLVSLPVASSARRADPLDHVPLHDEIVVIRHGLQNADIVGLIPSYPQPGCS